MIFTRNTARSTVLLAFFAALLLALGAAAAASLAGAPAAHAHDQLLSTDPADGDALEIAPEQLTLTFSGEIQDIGARVDLVDGDGATHETEFAAEGGDLVVTPNEALPAGDYTLSWRVISSDGHPIEGTVDNGEALDFEVASSGDDAAETTPEPSAAASSDPAMNPDEPATSGPLELELDNSSGWAGPAVVIILALAAIAAVVVVIAKVRKQQK
ncbi:copper resistance CopC family protein [Zhihengliuella halotolerans]|uniref:copper resistance CopC family protein n=1 Tax=Zhihengliuella halotolerans TaxID=370736 RepID=UPI000C802DA9|nr:copper resistance CopC family protein [Zhihengliuella halotolerans]